MVMCRTAETSGAFDHCDGRMKKSPSAAIVTGAESGIGAACAVALGSAGYSVALFYYSDAKLADATRKAVEAAGGHGVPVQCDVSDEASVAQAFEQAEASFGVACALVNSAGLNQSGVTVAALPADDSTLMLPASISLSVIRSHRRTRALAVNACPLVAVQCC